MSGRGGSATGHGDAENRDELGCKMLEVSGARLVYVNEPLNRPQHPPGRSPGVLRADVTHAFQYISECNERVWLPAFQDTVRLRGLRALLDDPYAVFAAPWLARRVGCQVVVTVRYLVATVSSWRRLGWTPRLAELLAQPALVLGPPGPVRARP